LADGTWQRQTTGKAALEHAIARACDIYDEARYRQRLGSAEGQNRTLFSRSFPADAGAHLAFGYGKVIPVNTLVR